MPMQKKGSGAKDLPGAGDGADEISGATNEGNGSYFEVLGERTKRKGVWLIWLVRHLEEDSWSLKGRTGRELM